MNSRPSSSRSVDVGLPLLRVRLEPLSPPRPSLAPVQVPATQLFAPLRHASASGGDNEEEDPASDASAPPSAVRGVKTRSFGFGAAAGRERWGLDGGRGDVADEADLAAAGRVDLGVEADALGPVCTVDGHLPGEAAALVALENPVRDELDAGEVELVSRTLSLPRNGTA